MQSGGSGGGPARNTGMGPAGRTTSTSSAASPSSSSSSVQQQQQQQQLASRQQQQQLRNSEANDGMFAYHAGGVQGMMGGGNFGSSPGSMQHPQQPRKFFESPHQQQQQQQGSSQEGQQSFNPMQQAYIQYALQAQQQKAQQQARMGMPVSSSVGKDQDARMGMLNMQDMMPMQASNQAQVLSSKPPGEQFARGERQMESGPQQRNETKPQHVETGQLMPGNMLRPMQAPQAPQGANKEPELDKWNLYLSNWGYNTEIERAEAASIPRIQVIELSTFSNKLK